MIGSINEVMLATAVRAGVAPLPLAMTTVWLANTASLLLPVSNLTNLLAMERVSHFVEAHPSVKLLALAFLILIGVILVADAFGHHVPKGYVYFSMAFSLGVELLNLRYRSRQARRRRRAA